MYIMLMGMIYKVLGVSSGGTRSSNSTEPVVLRTSPPKLISSNRVSAVVPSVSLELRPRVERSSVTYWSNHTESTELVRIGRSVIRSLGLDRKLDGVRTIHHESLTSDINYYESPQRTYLLDEDNYIVAIIRSMYNSNNGTVDPSSIQIWYDYCGSRKEVYVTNLTDVREVLVDVLSNGSESIVSWESKKSLPSEDLIKKFDAYGGEFNGR